MKILLSVLVLLFSSCYFSFSQQKEFKLCNPGMKWQGITLQSYHVNTSYSGGLRKIKQKFFTDFKQPSDANESGYLTLRFMVNCNGEIGMTEIMGSTFDFKEKVFRKSMSDRLIEILLTLGTWNPGVTGDGVKIDSQKYLTFIFENGTLKDITPK